MKKKNTLFYGDNLTIMQREIGMHAVDLIYLDPPFNSNQSYNLLYRTMTGQPVPEQAEAFFDTWHLDAEKREIARHMPELMRQHGVDPFYAKFWDLWMGALQNTQPKLLAYLIYMVQRLLYMKSILKPTGSIYLHCDPTASHYIKIMMDGIFGHDNFRNEIIWKRTGAHGRAKRWGPIHDVILFYSAGKNYKWNRVYQPYQNDYLETAYSQKDARGQYQPITLDGPGTRTGSSGDPWKGVNPTDKGRHWELPPDRALPSWFVRPNRFAEMSVQERLDVLDDQGLIYWPKRGSVPRFKRYASVAEGNPIQDIITDIGPLSSHSNERMGYPTQKPIELLKRIILASTNEGDVVFDPFCGCGTAIYAAHELRRKWVGCDIAILAVKIVREVLEGEYKLAEGSDFEVRGIPVSLAQAQELSNRDKFQFQHWFVERVGGFPTQKRSADKGVDGRLYFDRGGALEELIISVKGGAIKPADVRELRGTMEREGAPMAALLCLHEPTPAMRAEAEAAGLYEAFGTKYPRLQILSASDVLERKVELKTPSKVRTRLTSGQMAFTLA
ncbi:DNA methyltransferase [Sphingomonas sp.]|uniref:DNA methyltransferase n=1 Tax=Sphingomonas sp. TaxID=28214 RepID=UPI002ED8585C